MIGRLAGGTGLVLLVGFLAGCGSGGQPEVAAKTESPKPKFQLDQMLQMSRAELASRGDAVLKQIHVRDQAHADGKLEFRLLPKFRHPLRTPGFQDLKYVESWDLSLPAYVDPNKVEGADQLALHYARYGDLQAAEKLAEGRPVPGFTFEDDAKSYPIEWTRLVALQMYEIQQRIALGEAEALDEFLKYRQELNRALDDTTRQSPLGLDLLSRGRRTLRLAAAAWREQGNVKAAVKAEDALARWSDHPVLTPTNLSLDHWRQFPGAKVEGRVVYFHPAARALDLLDLPLPDDAADAVLLFHDSDGRLVDIFVVYNAHVGHVFARPADLAGALEDYAAWNNNPSTAYAYQQSWGNLAVEVRFSPYEATVGAWVRLRTPNAAQAQSVPRRLGLVDLDLTYERNRLTVAPRFLARPLVLKADKGALADFENPFPAGKLRQAILTPVDDRDLVASLELEYHPGTPWHALALPLFGRLGPGEWSNPQTSAGPKGFTEIVWQDDKTQLSLRVPHRSWEVVRVSFRDSRGPKAYDARSAEVRAKEERERRQRLDAGRPLVTLPRKLEFLPLGMERGDVLRYLPRGQNVIKRSVPDGLLVVNSQPPPKNNPGFVVRQWLVRFNEQGKLVWIQARYEATAAKSRIRRKRIIWHRQILQRWEGAGGRVAAQPSPYQARTADLTRHAARGTWYRWSDDLTEVSYLLNRSGVVVTVADRPPPGSDSLLPPLQYLPRGPSNVLDGLHLGESEDAVRTRLPHPPRVNADGAWVVGLVNGTYDAVLLWFDKGRLVRIAARHREGDSPRRGHKEMQGALTAAWGSVITKVGWPTERSYSSQGALQSLIWFDDGTRFHLYWAEGDNTPPRLWSEWRDDRESAS